MHLLRKWFNKIKQNKIPLILGSFFVFGFVLIPASSVHAQDVVLDTLSNAGNAFVNGMLILISKLLQEVIGVLGQFLVIIISFIQTVASYDGFRSQEQVIKGWQIVRDTVNSFYVIVLIAIAISTIIRWRPLDFRVALPRLIISAIIVNFSRTICLFAIAFSTILMNTFINAIGGAWPAFILGLRAPAILALQDVSVQGLVVGEFAKSPTIEGGNVIISQLFGIAVLIVAIVPLVAFLVILLFRIIALWVLIILSPLAFFLWGLVVKGTEYFNEWKNEFIKQILIGPVFVFFLYIIVLFFIANAQTISGDSVYGFDLEGTGVATRPLPSLISEPQIFFGYIVGIALMFVTLEVANRIGARGTGTAIGLGKKAAKGVLSAARAVDDLAYGYKARVPVLKHIPIPTFRGLTESKKALVDGFNEKRQALVAQGRQDRANLAQDYEGGRAGIAGVLANLSAGNKEFIKSTPLIFGRDSLAMRALPRLGGNIPFTNKGVGTDASQKTDTLHNESKQIENRQKAALAIENLPDNLRRVALGSTLGDVAQAKEGAQQALQRLQEDKQRYEQMEAQLDANEALLDDSDFMSEYTQLEDTVGSTGDYQGRLESLQKDVADMESIEQIFDKDGVNIEAGQTIREYESQLSSIADQEKGRLIEIIGELNRRKGRAQVAGSGIRDEFRKKGKEYRDFAYEQDEKPSMEIISANAMSNANNGNIPAFHEDVLKAADQSGFDNLYATLVPDFKMDFEGLKKAHAYNQKIGMSEQQSLELLSRAEGRHWADKKAAMTGFVKTDKTGKLRLIEGDPERNQVIRSNIENALKEVLTKGGKDAIGKKTQSGDYEMIQAAVDGIKNEIGKFRKIIEDNRQLTDFDAESIKMILKKKDELGLTPEDVRKLQAVEKKK